MPVNSYIQLRKYGTNDPWKQTQIPFGSYNDILVDATTHRRTVTGKLSSDFGKSYSRFEMVLRISHINQTRDGLSSITIDDLKLWMGSPIATNRTMEFKTFDPSTTYVVRSVEPFKRQYITPIINNTDSYFLVPFVIEGI